MDFNRFTEKLQDGFRAAQTLAAARSQQQLDVEHLLLALLEQESGLAQSILLKAGSKLETVTSAWRVSWTSFPRSPDPVRRLVTRST